MAKSKKLAGMTLVEIVMTVGIISFLTVLSLPQFANLQARQALQVSQKLIQTVFSRMQQLTLAASDPVSAASTYDIVGYGVLVGVRGEMTSRSFEGCFIDSLENSNRDYFAIVKFVRLKNDSSAIHAMLNPVSEVGSADCRIDPADYPNDFYFLPKGVVVSKGSSAPSFLGGNWLLVQTLHSTGSQFGSLHEYVQQPGWQNPLLARNDAVLVIESSRVKIRNVQLCQTVTIKTDTNGVGISDLVPFARCS